MESYSKEFRRDVLAACDAGGGTREVALRFDVSESWVRRIKQERREQGKLAPSTRRNRRKSWEPYAEWLLAKLAQQPDILSAGTSSSRQGRARLGSIGCDAQPRLSCACADAKKKTLITGEQEREDVVESRHQWSAQQLSIAPDQVVFIDETWAKTNMTRTFGCSLLGTRLIEPVPNDRWLTTTFLGALRSIWFVAPLCVDGAINGRTFLAWVQEHLVKSLRPGDVVVMDNLSSHKVKEVAEAIVAVGAELRYLPPYSPDLNPIELAFNKLKKLLRDGTQRTADKLVALCGQVLDLFTEHQSRNYFKHCGYRYS